MFPWKNYNLWFLRYLNETEQAVSFYYSVENSQTGIKVTFAIIYIIVVTLLLFLSTSIAITFASRLTKPIINLIGASDSISKGAFDVKVPEEETDEEFKELNKNFNITIMCNLHQTNLALEFSDRVIGLSDGSIVFDKKPKHLDKNIDKLYS